MSERELAALFHATGQDLNARQEARIKQLQGIERKLFEELAKGLVEVLDRGDGRISDRRGSVSINRLVDQLFRAIERGELKLFYQQAIKDLSAILENGALYNKELKPMKPSNFLSVKRSVNRTMRRRIGIDVDTGRVQQDGKLASIFNTDAARKSLKEILSNAVGSGKPMKVVMKELEAQVVTFKNTPGVLASHFSRFVLDTYNQFDRATSDAYAVKLDLKDFIYQGGLVEDSRDFCIEHDGKVFTRQEAETKWPRDPKLPRTTKERKTGVLIDYIPLVDMGRWHCRHRPRYISAEYADRLRAQGRGSV